ncbi:NmrA family NAD(P)-binding protein [Streptomyces sp900105755]|uniref:NmrA family NAD(P)-binding protein n=1 Tax=Streptomyces sp. 900105755 TaxID=3154389 RepID=A0ABV1TED9_9ACTN
MKVLAVGAAGASAGMVVPELVRRGVRVRGLVHDESRAGQARRNGAAETVVADLTDLAALTRACEGVDGVFGIIPAFAEDEARIGTTMVEAAVRAGVRKFVFSGVYHPTTSALSNHRGKQPAEAALYDSGLDFTVLQPAIFMQQLTGLWQSARRTGTIAMPYSADARMAYVDYRDVAEVAAESLVGDRFSGGTFELSSPGTHSREDLARLMGDVLGTEVTAESPDFDAWADAANLPAGPVRAGLKVMNQHYDRHGFHGGNALVLTAALGREPRTVRGFVEELARS